MIHTVRGIGYTAASARWKPGMIPDRSTRSRKAPLATPLVTPAVLLGVLAVVTVVLVAVGVSV